MRFAARLFHPSTLILIAANLLPLLGIWLWGWDTFLLLALYWMETAIIGFWTMLAIAILPIVAPTSRPTGARLVMVPFFIFHSGTFMTVHFMFLWSVFSGSWPNTIHTVRDFIDRIVIGEGLWIPLAALFFSRGVSFFFVMFGPLVLPSWAFAPHASPDDDPRTEGNLLKGFYLRIVIMHLTILFGAMIAIRFGNVAPLVLMVALKIAIDLKLHLKNDFPDAKPVVATTV